MNSAHQTWCSVQVVLSSVNLLPRLQCLSQHSTAPSVIFHVRLASVVGSISFPLRHHLSPSISPLDLQWFVSVDALPSAISEKIFIHQLQLVHGEDTVTNQSSAVHPKDLTAVQFHLQCFNQVFGSEGQLNPKGSAARNGLQCQVFFQRPSGPAVIKVETIERSEGLHILLLVHKVCRELMASSSRQNL